METPGDFSAIVLAAGRSARFGRDKRLERVDGVPMFLCAALKLQRLVPDTLIVLSDADAAHRRLASDFGLNTTICARARLGMGHSLAHGVARRRAALGWLIMPADMPFIRIDTLRRIVAAASSHARVAPTFQGTRGHPVWFSQRYGDALCALSGDHGARALLRTDPSGAQEGVEPVHWVPVDDAGCVRDVDYPGDLRGVTA